MIGARDVEALASHETGKLPISAGMLGQPMADQKDAARRLRCRLTAIGKACAGRAFQPCGFVKHPQWSPLTHCSAGFIRLHRSEEHTSELQSLMRISYAVFCLKKKKN